MMRLTRNVLALAGILILMVGSPARAQVPITSVGLGYRAPSLDGRATALGGTGLGLLGGSFSIRNPADLLLHSDPAFGISFSGETLSIEGAGRPLDTARERFTTIRAIVPFSDWAVGVGFGSVFDQDWSNRFQDTIFLSDGFVPFEESRENDGGISSIDLSLAHDLGPVAVGVSAQRLTGSLRQSFFRAFLPPQGSAPALGNAGGGQDISYRGWQLRGGASLHVSDRVVVSGMAGLGTTLEATRLGERDPAAEFDLPASFGVGGSAWLTDRLLVTAAAGWEGWSSVGDTEEFTSHDVTWGGAGLEWGGLSILGGRLPLRIGARLSQLPFGLGTDAISERAITGGFGWEFQQGLAALDLAVEAGSRGDFADDGLEESFSRVTLSFELRQRRR